MKNLWKKILWVLPMLFFIGCGGGGSSSVTTQNPNLKEFKVEVNVPNSVQNKTSSTFQKPTDSIPITRVEIEIKDATDSPLLDQAALLQLVNGLWSGVFILDTTKAPFTFVVHAYDKEGIERYSGTKTISNLQERISLSVSSVPQDGDTIKVPYLKSITSTLLAGGKQQLNVTVVNETFEDMNYNVLAIPNSCLSLFEPTFGTVTFKEGVLPAERIFTLDYLFREANDTCLNANYFLEMKTLSNQGFKVPLNLQNGPKGIVINFPPKIDSFNFTQDGENMFFQINASDAEGGDIFYTWEEVVGTQGHTLLEPQSGTNSQEWTVIKNPNYPQQETYRIKVTLTDGDGATRYYTYLVNNNSSSINTYTYPIKKTGQVTSYFTHDDGDYQKGVTPSYTRDDTKEVVIDNIEGYMWQDNSDVQFSPHDENVSLAKQYCSNLRLGGYRDWYVPNAMQLQSIWEYNKTKVGENVTFKYKAPNTLTSTTVYSPRYNQTWFFASISDSFGYEINNRTDGNNWLTHYRCVRNHIPLVNIVGVSRDNNTGIVRYPRYGLEWSDDANITKSSLQDAISYCDGISLGNHRDWRVPNIRELSTLIDYSSTSDTQRYWSAFKNNLSSDATWSSTHVRSSELVMEHNGETMPSEIYSDPATTFDVRCVRDYK